MDFLDQQDLSSTSMEAVREARMVFVSFWALMLLAAAAFFFLSWWG